MHICRGAMSPGSSAIQQAADRDQLLCAIFSSLDTQKCFPLNNPDANNNNNCGLSAQAILWYKGGDEFC